MRRTFGASSFVSSTRLPESSGYSKVIAVVLRPVGKASTSSGSDRVARRDENHRHFRGHLSDGLEKS